MAVVRLAVSCLVHHQRLADEAIPLVVGAYAPFGVRLVIQTMRLNADPVDAPGWRDVMAQLKVATASAGGPVPPLSHLVLGVTPPNFDTSINGQLLDRMRGICAVYLGAASFQVPEPAQQLALIVQVMIHEIGHMFDLVHEFTLGSGYSEAMLSTSDRLSQPVEQAWTLAIAKAQTRGEALQRPSLLAYYPFGETCRACLYDASTNYKWWPWNSPFRGDFGGAAEGADSSQPIRLSHEGSLRSSVGDGVQFTLRLENLATREIAIPAHVGPEFGSLAVRIRKKGSRRKVVYRPETFRCSSAQLPLAPGAVEFRSFSIVPHPDAPIFDTAGEFVLEVSLLGPYPGGRLALGTVQIPVAVRAAAAAMPARKVAAALVASARSTDPLPTRSQFGRLRRINADSVLAAHARYKLALLHTGAVRDRLLSECMGLEFPIAVRHRAARQSMLNTLRAQGDVSRAMSDLRARFSRAEDAELHRSLQQMEDGWTSLSA